MPTSRPCLYTAGYQGLTIDRFLAALRAAGIRRVIDIRWNPRSRKPGFSQQALHATLRQEGMAYCHLPELGSPPKLRKQWAASGDWSRFERGYRQWLEHQEPALARIAAATVQEPVALLCFEEDWTRCHRSLVAQELLAGRLAGYTWQDFSRSGWSLPTSSPRETKLPPISS